MWERESLPSFSSPHLITPAPVRTTELESFRTELCTGAATVRPKIWIEVYWVWAQSTKPASLAAHGKHRRVLGIRSVLAGKAHSFCAHHVCRKQKTSGRPSLISAMPKPFPAGENSSSKFLTVFGKESLQTPSTRGERGCRHHLPPKWSHQLGLTKNCLNLAVGG